jgi:diketogulonate reductase-like aldo/keto reductase
VPYGLSERSIERDLLPWSEKHGVPVMAYSPLGGDAGTLVRDPTLTRIGAAHNCSAAAVVLAWAICNARFSRFLNPVRWCMSRKTLWHFR